MRNVYTVRQVNSYIKNMFAQDFMLNRIYVKGEISNCKYHTSGHIYFSLKDESGTIACVMFAGSRSGLSFRLQEGQQVIVLGSVSVYERDGKYQLYAREIVRDGLGALYEKYEALKKELEEMGMFSEEYKQPIPRFVKTVGIVTAPTGAAVRDIINISQRRNPYVQLILYPAQVQGEGAAQSIVRGIRALEEKKVDVIIVGRGGGSIEDLWAFNEEITARAIFAAAELAVYDYRDALERIAAYRDTLRRMVLQKAADRRNTLERLALRLRYTHPRQKLNENRQYAADLENRLRTLMGQRLEKERHRLAIAAERMKGLSPLDKLSQGFSYSRDAEGKNIRSIGQTGPGEQIEVFVSDGVISAEVVSVQRIAYPDGTERNGSENAR